MCGFAGIINFKEHATSGAGARVSGMLDAMPWRGPDDRGERNSPVVALGHLRLSIIDLSKNASQPMQDIKGRTIVFNGEIYNYLEIRNELKGYYDFKTRSDTEVILAGYDKWGENCVNHFNGDWAFIINDPQEKKVFVSRDRFGIKPLYYYLDDKTMVIASEVRAVIEGTDCRTIPRANLVEFLKYRRHENPQSTLIEKIKPFPPGKSMIVGYNGRVDEITYYSQENLFSAEVPKSIDLAMEHFGELFEDAVELRLRSDVPVGTCLSGGLDSSAITAIASRHVSSGLNTYSAVFPNYDADESVFSARVAGKYKTDHHVIEPSLDDFFNYYDNFILAQDSPFPSPKALARYVVLKKAAQDVKVILSGQGGDEIFGGYGSCYKIYRRDYEEQFGKKLLMTQSRSKGPESKIPALGEFTDESLLAKISVKRYVDCLDPPRDSYTNRQYVLLSHKILSLLHTEDRLAMIHSIEARVPMLDHRLVEYCFSLPVEFKMQEYDKYLMRLWIDKHGILPQEVTFRTDKKGFSTSFGELLRTRAAAIEWFKDRLRDIDVYMPFVDRKIVFQLIEEQAQYGVDNTDRLLTLISLKSYMCNNGLKLYD